MTSLIELLDTGVERFPDRAALVDGETVISYRDLGELSRRIANGLHASGIERGAKVAVYSPNSALAFACVLGALRAGATWVPINARNVVADTVSLLRLADCDCLFFHSEFSDHVSKIVEEVPTLRVLVSTDRPTLGHPSLDDWLAPFSAECPGLEPSPEDVALLLGTGGTTGRPKAVALSHRNVLTMSAACSACMPTAGHPINLVVAPMTHAAGVLIFPLLEVGATNVVLSKPEPLEILTAIERERVTHLFLPPTLIYLLLAHPQVREFDYSSLEYFIYAAAPISLEKLKEALSVFGGVMAQLYGQVEAPMVCTYLSPEDHVLALDSGKEDRLRSCGRPTQAAELAIMDDAGRLLPPNERGEIVVRGDLVMKGYYKDPDATAEASAHGWHHTGDIGYLDEDGFAYIVDRKKDLIISGGFNVYPSEVEQVLWAHPAVRDCAVIGVPDEKWGEAVKAVVELKPGHSVTESELIAFCKERLGGVKCPKSVEFSEHLPRSPVGKVLKKEIRAPFWADRWRAI